MMRYKGVFPLLFAAVALTVVGCQDADLPTSGDSGTNETQISQKFTPNPEGTDRYIVVMEEGATGEGFSKAVTDLTSQYGVTPEVSFKHSISGFAARLSAGRAAELAANPRVKYVEPDYKVQLVTTPYVNTTVGGQTTPWGVKRVGGSRDGSGKVAWIVDTGIDFEHADLNVDRTRSRNFVPDGRTADDGNGHGTHVAGIVGARNNGRDVIGVAANATLVAVRVLDNNGSGYYSSMIAGMDYIAANAKAGDVVNMSLGGPASNGLDDAVRRVANKGIKVVIAAGNSAVNAVNTSPARVNLSNVYTVSATDQWDKFASFSNYGNPPVDIAAPGVYILSTRNGGGTVYMSGTSMAAPHVAGLLLFGYVRTNGTAQNDPDGNADRIAYR